MYGDRVPNTKVWKGWCQDWNRIVWRELTWKLKELTHTGVGLIIYTQEQDFKESERKRPFFFLEQLLYSFCGNWKWRPNVNRQKVGVY